MDVPHPSRRGPGIPALLGFLAACLLLGFRFGEVPPGINLDEASVGFNAAALASDGLDQYGEPVPLFIRALHDFKSPLYVYPAVISVGMLGPTVVAVRLPALLFGVGAAVLLYLLLRRLVPERVAGLVAVFSMVVPSLYLYGRQGVSEASTFPFFLLLALIAACWFLDAPSRERALLAGMAMGLCTYCYSTGRLFAPLGVAALGVMAMMHAPLRRCGWGVLVGGALVGLPMGVFMLEHPMALTGRFHGMSIFAAPTALDTIGLFSSNYLAHLSPGFLFIHGDANPRHNAGTGMLSIWMAVPLLVGIVVLVRRRREPFMQLLGALVLLAPIPAALTNEGIPHASRTLHMVPLVLVICALGVQEIAERLGRPREVVAVLALVATVEGGVFALRYHRDHPAVAQMAFDGGATKIIKDLAAARTDPSIPVRVPMVFFQRYALHVAYFLEVPAAEYRVNGMGANVLPLEAPVGPGPCLWITLGDTRPPGHPDTEQLAVSTSLTDGRTLFSLYRTR